MPTKTKTTKTPLEKLSQASQQAGLMLMTAAVTIGMLEVPDQPDKRVIVPSQPAFAFAENTPEENNPTALRREREEAGPHYISYSVAERTPSRAGKP